MLMTQGRQGIRAYRQDFHVEASVARRRDGRSTINSVICAETALLRRLKVRQFFDGYFSRVDCIILRHALH